VNGKKSRRRRRKGEALEYLNTFYEDKYIPPVMLHNRNANKYLT
jgi:hypothetical protein